MALIDDSKIAGGGGGDVAGESDWTMPAKAAWTASPVSVEQEAVEVDLYWVSFVEHRCDGLGKGPKSGVFGVLCTGGCA